MIQLPDGFALVIQGQEYRPVGQVEHISAKGQPSTLIVWETACPICGAKFEIKTSVKVDSPTRRCERCRNPKITVSRHKKSLRIEMRG